MTNVEFAKHLQRTFRVTENADLRNTLVPFAVAEKRARTAPNEISPFGPIEPTGRILTGDGTWPFTARIDGEDIVCEDIVITCFGGYGKGRIADPQDNGQTASGRNTKNEEINGVSIAMDARQFPGLDKRDPAGFRALKGAPFPKLPWGTLVEVTILGQTYTPPDGIVDLGPGKQASKPGKPHALDLTPWAAKRFVPDMPVEKTATRFSARGSFRILGAAKYAS